MRIVSDRLSIIESLSLASVYKVPPHLRKLADVSLILYAVIVFAIFKLSMGEIDHINRQSCYFGCRHHSMIIEMKNAKP